MEKKEKGGEERENGRKVFAKRAAERKERSERSDPYKWTHVLLLYLTYVSSVKLKILI